MDPDANLKEQRAIAKRMQEREDAFDEQKASESAWEDFYVEESSDGAELAELVLALNDWICRGGFLPKDWRPR